jgi:hypothetical protein
LHRFPFLCALQHFFLNLALVWANSRRMQKEAGVFSMLQRSLKLDIQSIPCLGDFFWAWNGERVVEIVQC